MLLLFVATVVTDIDPKLTTFAIIDKQNKAMRATARILIHNDRLQLSMSQSQSQSLHPLEHRTMDLDLADVLQYSE